MRFGELIEPRDFTHAYSAPSLDDPRRESFIQNLLAPYKMIIAIGLSCTGKSTLINEYKGKPNHTLTRWNRDTVIGMLDSHGRRSGELYGSLDKFEDSVFPRLLEDNYHQAIIETWGRFPRSRARYSNYVVPMTGKVACLVFDGPIDLIIERNIAAKNDEKYNRTPEDLEMYLRQAYDDFRWPKHNEGFDDIIYINTFEEAGEEYLKLRLI
jgi:hypothetical protein